MSHGESGLKKEQLTVVFWRYDRLPRPRILSLPNVTSPCHAGGQNVNASFSNVPSRTQPPSEPEHGEVVHVRKFGEWLSIGRWVSW